MAGLVFRPYWINDKIYYFGVLGDISLDNEFRGKGIAKDFFLFINLYLREKVCDLGLVIPNVPAQKSLSSSGWRIVEKFIPHVFIVNPYIMVLKIIKIKNILKLFGNMYELFLILKLSSRRTYNIKLEMCEHFDESFNDLWKKVDKKGLIISNREQAP